jgi:hypothetical protein
MAQNKEALRYTHDGVYDITAAALLLIAARSRAGTAEKHYLQVGGVHSSYLNRIKASGLIYGGRWIDNWVLVPMYDSPPEPQFRNEKGRWARSRLTVAPAIMHNHPKSSLACATEYLSKLRWRCCTCKEAVPVGVLFMARTERIRQAL